MAECHSSVCFVRRGMSIWLKIHQELPRLVCFREKQNATMKRFEVQTVHRQAVNVVKDSMHSAFRRTIVTVQGLMLFASIRLRKINLMPADSIVPSIMFEKLLPEFNDEDQILQSKFPYSRILEV